MAKLYVHKIEEGYEIPESQVKKYHVVAGQLTPWTGLRVISSDEKETDIMAAPPADTGTDIRRTPSSKYNADIKGVPSKDFGTDIKAVRPRE